MKKYIIAASAVWAFAISSAYAQAIDVTTTGVNIGVTTSSTSGSLLQQLGQTTSFWTQDGINPPTLRMTIKDNGNVGIGTATPTQKLEVSGNTVTSGSATVGSLIVGSSPILSVGSFESAEQAIPGNNVTITIPHGLGGLPKFTTVALRCKTAEHGWAAGDELMLNSLLEVGNGHGVTFGVNASSFKLVEYGNIYIHTFGSNQQLPITPANWRLVFRAWR